MPENGDRQNVESNAAQVPVLLAEMSSFGGLGTYVQPLLIVDCMEQLQNAGPLLKLYVFFNAVSAARQ